MQTKAVKSQVCWECQVPEVPHAFYIKNKIDKVLQFGTMCSMKQKHHKTLELIFKRPVSGSIKWPDIEKLFIALGAEVTEREGSRVAVFMFNEVRIFHRPHPTPDTDKGAVVSIRKWLKSHGVAP